MLLPHALELPLWITLSWLGFALVSLQLAARQKTWPSSLKLLLTLAGVAGVVLQYGTIIGPRAGVALLIFLSGAKLLETKTARDRLGLLFVGFFLLVAYFLNSQSLSMAAYMAFAAVALVTGMIVNLHPALPWRRSLGLSSRLLLQALPLALLLFILFPRLQGPIWGLPQQAAAQSGLSDQMSPGDFGRLTLSNEIAFRAEFEPLTAPGDEQEKAKPNNEVSIDPRALYWRGPVLWDFDGRTWKTRFAPQATPINALADGPRLRYNITLEPHRQHWLFLLGLPHTLPPQIAGLESRLGPDLQWLANAPITQRIRYSVEADLNYQLDPNGLEAAHAARLLALPAGNPAARRLAQQWLTAKEGQAPTPRAVVQQALQYFRQEAFFYTLQPPLLGENSVDDFLFTRRRGFCEHYASAFVFLMRAAGIPARVVTGYQGGELNPLGNYWIVRQRDAHAWAEVWLAAESQGQESGWVRIDPTAAVAPNRVERGVDEALPAGERSAGIARLDAGWLMPIRLTWDLMNNQWNQWVLGYNQEKQRQFLARFNPFLATWQGMAWGLGAVGGLLLLVMAALIAPRWWRAKADPVQQIYQRFCRRLARCGIVRAESEGPADFATRASQLRPDLAEAIKNITYIYLSLRYGQLAAADEISRMTALKRMVKKFSTS